MAIAARILARSWFVLPIAALAIALLATRVTLADVKRESAQRADFIARVVAETRAAAGAPALIERDVPAQIAALGRSVGALSNGLAVCNVTARAAAERDQALQRAATAALENAETRAAGRADQIARLRASAARPVAPAEACAPSEEVERAWR